MKVLILGGTGAMGVPVVNILANKNYDVFITTRYNRISTKNNVKYLVGNAMELEFINNILKDKYDVVIDFMVYTVDQFKERLDLFLDNTNQYIFMSSSRVYNDSEGKLLNENSSRLLDSINDENYKQSNEYAIAKAREENYLINSDKKNWTIIRPYITFNDYRLQLGVFEKEVWLQRALNGKTIVFSKDIASKYTTLTYGGDVSKCIVGLIDNKESLGQIFHVTTTETIKWEDVLKLYIDTILDITGKKPKVVMLENSKIIGDICHNHYQIKYDRLFDRKFDNKKIVSFNKDISFEDTRVVLRKCLTSFLNSNRPFLGTDWRLEGALDRICNEKSKVMSIKGHKNKIKYFVYRYLKYYNYVKD